MDERDYHRVLVSDIPRFLSQGWRVANDFLHFEAPDRAWIWMVREVAQGKAGKEKQR